ncbi:MAG: hypothetical protein FJ382_14770, partial [Verrucomicrobia bacterium]|nr:hypothetical protein [Verrucomicrobiota bacterium]
TAAVQNVYNGTTYSLTTSPAVLTVIAAPVFTTQPLSRTVLAGTQVTFTAAVQGLAATTFQWRKNGTAIGGATGSSYSINSPVTSDSGTYTVVATNGEGSTTSNPAELVVNALVPPTISGAPANVTIPNGERTQLKVTATGTGTLAYQWYTGTSGSTASPVAGATSPTFTTPTLASTTSYWVRITDANGGVTNSPTVTVTVSATSPLTVTQQVLAAGYRGGETIAVTNTITYTGTAPSRIDWSTLLPVGWKYLGSGGSEGGVRPTYKNADLIEWSWTTVPPSPIEFTYTVGVPAGTTGDQVIASLVTSQAAGTNYQTMAKPDPLVIRSASLHSADSNRDGKISLTELTRVIELYNYRSGTTRTGQYKVQAGTEDGFAPGPGTTVVNIQMVIDHDSALVIAPTGLYWRHYGYAKPGFYGNSYEIPGPFLIGTQTWTPTWDTPGSRDPGVSSVFVLNTAGFSGWSLSQSYGGAFNSYPQDYGATVLAQSLSLNRGTVTSTTVDGFPAIRFQDFFSGQNVYSVDLRFER